MSERKHITTATLVVVILALGLFSTWFTWNLTTRKLSEGALEQARLVARSINPKRLQSLKGNKADLTSPDYLRIKEQLTQIRQAHRTCRFLYLMGRKNDGTVFFFLDSQPPASENYAPPGLIYEEVSDEYLYTFDTGKQRTVGPIKDRWGTLVTSLVPIYAYETNELIAILGMDIRAKDWNKMIISQCLLPVGLTIFIMLLTIFLFILNRNRQMIKMQYNEKNKIATELQQTLQHVKRLQGILPICAKCKKIRDDKGYWNQIESYISEHSEADFSHGICPECAEELYGDQDWFKKEK
jgi:hypothetical protein